MFGQIGEWVIGFLSRVFGSANARKIRAILPTVEAVGALEAEMAALSDAELKGKTEAFRRRLAEGEALDDLLVEAFAVCREAGKRTLGMRHFDVQIIGGTVLHRGSIAEMITGEGKTLVATLPAYLNALEGEGVHVVTVNDYLARRDMQWMRPLYNFLGLKVGAIQSQMLSQERMPHYQADITYGTNNEFGFDYLRDNMKASLDTQCQKRQHYAIIDEVDSILIDEARTPLIISGAGEEAGDMYYKARDVVARLKGMDKVKIEQRAKEQGVKPLEIEGDWDYVYSEKDHTVAMSEQGIQRAQELVGVEDFYTGANMDWPHHLNQAIRAKEIYKRDKEYVVDDGEVVIVDEFTGLKMPGRTWSDGLHQAIEAKERLKVKRENQTLATITFQNFFKLYDKIAGMTGTAMTEAEEFLKIYEVECLAIPTNRVLRRKEFADVIYRSIPEKYRAICDEIAAYNRIGRPVLVGTISIENSEMLSEALSRRGVPHDVLNAKHHQREAHIVATAGQLGRVTIATNMAGRGTDIVLGAFPEQELLDYWAKTGVAPKGLKADDPYLYDKLEKHWGKTQVETPFGPVPLIEDWEYRGIARSFKDSEGKERKGLPVCRRIAELGGLHIVGTERHESRRIDNQLRGRCGRQGDPGSSRFFLSLQDDLMRLFAPDRVGRILTRLGWQENQELSHRMVSKAIERAQKKVEAHNFDIRKRLLEMDEVMNEQRKLVYSSRQEVLEGNSDSIREMIHDWIDEVIERHSQAYLSPFEGKPDPEGLLDWALRKFEIELDEVEIDEDSLPTEVAAEIKERVFARYREREEEIGEEEMRRIESFLLLQKIDEKWKDHLHGMDQLRSGIHLRGYAQVDPKDAYKKEGYELFEEMVGNLKDEVTDLLFRLRVKKEEEQQLLGTAWNFNKMQAVHQDAQAAGALAKGAQQMRQKAEQGTEGEKLKPFEREAPKLGRNEPCWCGSGKKYKRCHWPDPAPTRVGAK